MKKKSMQPQPGSLKRAINLINLFQLTTKEAHLCSQKHCSSKQEVRATQVSTDR